MAYAVSIRDVPTLDVVGVRIRVPRAEIGSAIGTAVGDVMAYLLEHGATPAGPPRVVYHDVTDAEVEMEVCTPVAPGLPGAGEISPGQLPAGSVAWTVHDGPYTTEHEAYEALATYMEEHGHRPCGPPREIYVVGPAETPDEQAYRTEIEWPVAV